MERKISAFDNSGLFCRQFKFVVWMIVLEFSADFKSAHQKTCGTDYKSVPAKE